MYNIRTHGTAKSAGVCTVPPTRWAFRKLTENERRARGVELGYTGGCGLLTQAKSVGGRDTGERIDRENERRIYTVLSSAGYIMLLGSNS